MYGQQLKYRGHSLDKAGRARQTARNAGGQPLPPDPAPWGCDKHGKPYESQYERMNDYLDKMSARNHGARMALNGARAAVAGIGAGLLWHLAHSSGNHRHRHVRQHHR